MTEVRATASASATPGSALSGRSDRVGACDGTLWVARPPSEGTVMLAVVSLDRDS